MAKAEKKGGSGKYAMVAAVTLLAILLPFGFVMVSATVIACEEFDKIPFVECEVIKERRSSEDCQDSTGNVPVNIPPEWRKIIMAAATEQRVPPNFLAALYLTENGNKWRPLDYPWPESEIPGLPEGAKGPMQFLEGTFRQFQVTGHPDIENPEDALFAAANMVSGSDYGSVRPGMPIGDLDAPFQPGTLLYSAARYNWGSGHVDENTEPDSPLSVAPEETQEYLRNVKQLLETDLAKSGHKSHGDPREVDINDEVVIHEDDGGDAPGVFAWPVSKDAPITSGFQTPDRPDHHGVDFGAPLGSAIYAVTDGDVLFAGPSDPDGYGNLIKIEHFVDGESVESWYAHMPDAEAFVEAGETVEAGEQIATVGEAGRDSTGPHLHFEVHPYVGEAIDPLIWLEQNGATGGVIPDVCGIGGDIDGVKPPEKDANGNWPKESCSVTDHPAAGGVCVTPRTATIFDAIKALGFTNLFCFAERAAGEHPLGRACDIAPGQFGVRPVLGDDVWQRGEFLANFLKDNADTWGVMYVIWYGRIWTVARADEGWRTYEGAISGCDVKQTTCGHYDHIHVSMF